MFSQVAQFVFITNYLNKLSNEHLLIDKETEYNITRTVFLASTCQIIKKIPGKQSWRTKTGQACVLGLSEEL